MISSKVFVQCRIRIPPIIINYILVVFYIISQYDESDVLLSVNDVKVRLDKLTKYKEMTLNGRILMFSFIVSKIHFMICTPTYKNGNKSKFL